MEIETPQIAISILLEKHSQEEISKIVGVSQATISRISRGKFDPRWSTAAALIKLASKSISSSVSKTPSEDSTASDTEQKLNEVEGEAA